MAFNRSYRELTGRRQSGFPVEDERVNETVRGERFVERAFALSLTHILQFLTGNVFGVRIQPLVLQRGHRRRAHQGRLRGDPGEGKSKQDQQHQHGHDATYATPDSAEVKRIYFLDGVGGPPAAATWAVSADTLVPSALMV